MVRLATLLMVCACPGSTLLDSQYRRFRVTHLLGPTDQAEPQQLVYEPPTQENCRDGRRHEMNNYVVGFLFSKDSCSYPCYQDCRDVLLIEKQRPEWQQGLLNGVGGHVESGEEPFAAMRREFLEETGLKVNTWELCVVLIGKLWVVHFFSAYGSVWDAKDQTDEELRGIAVADLFCYNVIPNLRWLIPLCLDRDVKKPLFIQDIAASEAAHITSDHEQKPPLGVVPGASGIVEWQHPQ